MPLASKSSDPIQRSAQHKVPVGTRARRLQRRILLSDHSLHGLYWIADQFVFRPLVSALRIVPLIMQVGRKAQRDCGISIPRQIVEMLQLVLFHGAKPWMYYVTECHRPGGMRDAGEIVMRNETKHGLFKALNRIDPEARNRARKLGDKLDVADWCAENGIPNPQPILIVERGQIQWRGSRDDLDRDLFIKRRRGRGTFGSASYWRTGPFEYRDDDGHPFTLAQIMADLADRSKRSARNRRLLVMPRLRNHPALADLTGESLITLRLWTCLDETLRPVLTNIYLRSITKLEPKWDVHPIEEYGAPIDPETGALGRITGDKPVCLSEWFDHHPVTGARVTGRIVPFTQEVVQLALKAHSIVPERVMIGWDMAITPEGPVLLEGNSFADTIFPQRVFRQAIGHMRLGELLHFHLDRLEAKLDERTKR